jgi:hypothetical protein
MSVNLNRPGKPEESQKNSNFNGKTIPYPGFEPRTSGLAVGSHNHCTIGSVDWYYTLGTEFHNPDSSLECTPYENHVLHDSLWHL